MGTVVASGSLRGVMVSVVVCNDLSDKELHRQVGKRGYSGGIREPRWCNG